MKKIILFALVLLMSSCVYSHMYHFEEGDLEWINPYEVGDMITFETSKGIDTLYITEKNIYDKTSPFIENEGQDMFDDYYASADYWGYFIHNNSKHHFFMLITKHPDGGLGIRITLMELYSNLIEIKRNVNEPSAFIKDTIIVDETNSEYKKSGPVPDNCEYLKWSKKEGLIEYRLRDGTVYPR